MKDVRIIKGLQSQVNVLEADAEALKIEISHKQKEREQKIRTIKSLKDQISSINDKQELKVSEHAMVRYFERVKGFNLEEIEQEILDTEVIRLVDTLGGSGTYPNPKNYSIVLKNYTVTTII